MQTLFESLTGNVTNLEQTGDLAATGRLVNVQEDYASILTDKQQLIHYPNAGRKSVNTTITDTLQLVPAPDVSFPPSFMEMLDTLLFRLVQIETGDGARQGVLSSFNDDEICIVVNTNEVVYYPIHQMKYIAPICRTEKDQSESGDTSSSRFISNNQSEGNGSSNAEQPESSASSVETQPQSSPNLEEERSQYGKSVRHAVHCTIIESSDPTPSFVNKSCRIKRIHGR